MNDYNRGALPDPCLRLDYGFGEQWASVELGDGTGYVRLSDYEKLESENAKLREECDYHKALWQHAHVTDCELRRVRAAWKKDRDENAKLRELVFRMRPICMEGKRCTFADRIYISSTMEELGIEANWEELGIDG